MLIPISFMKVEAKSFTINELVGKFNDIGTIQAQVYGKMAATIDSDNKKIKLDILFKTGESINVFSDNLGKKFHLLDSHTTNNCCICSN